MKIIILIIRMNLIENISFYNNGIKYNIEDCITYINNLCYICETVNCDPIKYCNNILLFEDKFNNENTFDNVNVYKKINIKFNNYSSNSNSNFSTPIKKKRVVKNNFSKDIWEL